MENQLPHLILNTELVPDEYIMIVKELDDTISYEYRIHVNTNTLLFSKDELLKLRNMIDELL